MHVIQIQRGLPMKALKIEDLISRKNEQEEVHVDGISIPVLVLKKLMEDGYAHLRVYGENRTVSLWGSTCSASLNNNFVKNNDDIKNRQFLGIDICSKHFFTTASIHLDGLQSESEPH
jgi:hypothetical protein